MSQAWVKYAVREIHDKVRNNVEGRYENDGSLDDRVISAQDTIQQQPTHPGPGKHDFGNDRTAEKGSELQSLKRQYWQHRVAQGMSPEHASLRDAFRTRGAHIVR